MPIVFNRENKAVKHATRYMENRGQREQNARARRDDKQKQDIDVALRKPLQAQPAPASPIANVSAGPTVEPLAPVSPSAVPTAAPPAATPRPVSTGQRQVSELANVPGGGALATQMQASQQKVDMKTEEQIWTLLQKGESERSPGLIDQARYLNQQSGAGIPDYFFDDPQIRSQLTQIIAVARKNSSDPRQISATIQGALMQNPDLMARIAQSERSGRGLPEGIKAGAEVAKGQEKEKGRNIRARARGAQDKYPEKRIRLDLLKQYRLLTTTNEFGEKSPMYPDEYSLNQAVDERMSAFGYPQKPVQRYDPTTGLIK